MRHAVINCGCVKFWPTYARLWFLGNPSPEQADHCHAVMLTDADCTAVMLTYADCNAVMLTDADCNAAMLTDAD
jgi:hypothetical protein